MSIRPLEARDRAPIAALLTAIHAQTGIFTEEEVRVALELVDESLGVQTEDPYVCLVAERQAEVVGYVCYGHTPMTKGTYDLYWVAVSPAARGGGVGRSLMRAAEDAMRAEGGRIVIVETASRAAYVATRAFYDSIGYVAEAVLHDYYEPGDSKVLYTRRL